MFLTLRLLGNRHPSFIARTVFVKNNDVDDACRIVNRILGKEGILEQFRLTRYYEKPFQVVNVLGYYFIVFKFYFKSFTLTITLYYILGS